MLCLAHSEAALSDTVRQFLTCGREFLVLGAGSNLLIPDGALSCPVVKLGRDFSLIRPQGPETLAVGAAVAFSRLLNYCIKQGLSGLEPLCGIPGSVGGMARMNASSFGREIFSLIKGVRYIDRKGDFFYLPAENISRGYRSSFFDKEIITEVVFSLQRKSGGKEIAGKYFRKRCSSQDYKYPSLGCIFRNPPGFSAGKLIEECGLKGFCVGEACVSQKHANFIINKGNAFSSEVLELIGLIKNKVRTEKGILLEEEIEIW